MAAAPAKVFSEVQRLSFSASTANMHARVLTELPAGGGVMETRAGLCAAHASVHDCDVAETTMIWSLEIPQTSPVGGGGPVARTIGIAQYTWEPHRFNVGAHLEEGARVRAQERKDTLYVHHWRTRSSQGTRSSRAGC